jgi:hypothetical protein
MQRISFSPVGPEGNQYESWMLLADWLTWLKDDVQPGGHIG